MEMKLAGAGPLGGDGDILPSAARIGNRADRPEPSPEAGAVSAAPDKPRNVIIVRRCCAGLSLTILAGAAVLAGLLVALSHRSSDGISNVGGFSAPLFRRGDDDLRRRLGSLSAFSDPKTVIRIDRDDGSFVVDGASGDSAVATTFAFIIGLEGVGHHFVGELLGEAPNLKLLEDLNLCEGDSESLHSMNMAMFHSKGRRRPWGGLFNPNPPADSEFDSRVLYGEIVHAMSSINAFFATTFPPGGTLLVPVNANRCAGRGGGTTEMSYPNLRGTDRAMNYPSLDLFYDACDEAEVSCKHIYMYRNPYDVLESTSKRKFNSDVAQGMRLYTMQLHIIYAQMSHHAGGTYGCFGFLDAEGAERVEDIDRFGRLFGWDSIDSFREVYYTLNKNNNPMPMDDSRKRKLVPPELEVLMRAYLEIHERVVNLCYSSL